MTPIEREKWEKHKVRRELALFQSGAGSRRSRLSRSVQDWPITNRAAHRRWKDITWLSIVACEMLPRSSSPATWSWRSFGGSGNRWQTHLLRSPRRCSMGTYDSQQGLETPSCPSSQKWSCRGSDNGVEQRARQLVSGFHSCCHQWNEDVVPSKCLPAPLNMLSHWICVIV